jgi:hypothetical protein
MVGRGGFAPDLDGTDLDAATVGDLTSWAVPALVLTVPGLLVLLTVLAQTLAGLLWLPVARRWLGAFGLRRRTRRAPEPG